MRNSESFRINGDTVWSMTASSGLINQSSTIAPFLLQLVQKTALCSLFSPDRHNIAGGAFVAAAKIPFPNMEANYR
jgi:hypothetical protein